MVTRHPLVCINKLELPGILSLILIMLMTYIDVQCLQLFLQTRCPCLYSICMFQRICFQQVYHVNNGHEYFQIWNFIFYTRDLKFFLILKIYVLGSLRWAVSKSPIRSNLRNSYRQMQKRSRDCNLRGIGRLILQ